MAPLAFARLYVPRAGPWTCDQRNTARLGSEVSKSPERTPSKATPKGESSDGGWLAPVPGTELLHAAGRRAARISAHSRPTGKAPRQALNLLHCGFGERLAGVTTLPSLEQPRESGSIKSPMRSEYRQTLPRVPQGSLSIGLSAETVEPARRSVAPATCTLETVTPASPDPARDSPGWRCWPARSCCPG
jgi:hypothetical protein